MLLARCLLSPIERFRFWRIRNHATVIFGLEVGMVENDAVSMDFSKQVLGYGLTTAEIVYRRPDRHWLLQTYVWQDYDLFPNFPALKDFLAFWEKSLKDPCSQLPLRTRNSSSQPNCTPSTACSGCTDSTGPTVGAQEARSDGDLTARRVRRVQARAIAQDLRSHRSSS